MRPHGAETGRRRGKLGCHARDSAVTRKKTRHVKSQPLPKSSSVAYSALP
jgi:hypothetical protein